MAMGLDLLQDVGTRICAEWLKRQGKHNVLITRHRQSLGGRFVDLTYSGQRGQRRIKVKADPYFGTDARKIRDRELPFYRMQASDLAFEAVADAVTREPGWMLRSDADDLYYYYLALSQSEDEVRALMNEPDDVFFAELAVDRDELLVLPVARVRDWFEANFERYPPRPVDTGGASAWYRLIPRADLEQSIGGITSNGPIFFTLGR